MKNEEIVLWLAGNVMKQLKKKLPQKKEGEVLKSFCGSLFAVLDAVSDKGTG